MRWAALAVLAYVAGRVLVTGELPLAWLLP